MAAVDKLGVEGCGRVESDKMRWDHILLSLQCHAGRLNHSAMIHIQAERNELIQEILRPKCILLVEEIMTILIFSF